MLTFHFVYCYLPSIFYFTTVVQLLIRFLTATPLELGYCNPIIPRGFEISSGYHVQEFVPIAIVQHGTRRYGTYVYRAKMGTTEVVMKVAPERDINSEVSDSLLSSQSLQRELDVAANVFVQ
jgi:hypothetical protein